MIVLDAFFRFSGVGLLLLLAVLSVRDVRKTNGAIYLILACISVSALFLGYTPEFARLPKVLNIVVRVLDIPHLIFVWLFALSLFQDEFRISWFHIVIGVLFCLPILYIRLVGLGVIESFPSWFIVMGSLMSGALMIHLSYATLVGRAADLREKRRASRIYFVVVIVSVAILAAMTEIVFTGENLIYLRTAKVIVIWPAIAWACYWILKARTGALEFTQANGENSTNSDMSFRNKELANALEEEMLGNRAFLETRLSIPTLARRLGVTPHRLRDLINHGLGYQNFNVFLNAYRIDAVKLAFADPKNAHIPILTIVMKYGFNSLSPFNNAFLAKEGVTPSEYRKKIKH